MRDDKLRLEDAKGAINKILKYSKQGRTAFEDNELIQIWIVHHMQVLGESAAKLSEQLKDKHPELPWRNIIGMRNILIHGYFLIDLDIVWQTVEKDIPVLKKQLAVIIKSLKGSESGNNHSIRSEKK
jgi:uncharacterized protein with HEPN domain